MREFDEEGEGSCKSWDAGRQDAETRFEENWVTKMVFACPCDGALWVPAGHVTRGTRFLLPSFPHSPSQLLAAARRLRSQQHRLPTPHPALVRTRRPAAALGLKPLLLPNPEIKKGGIPLYWLFPKIQEYSLFGSYWNKTPSLSAPMKPGSHKPPGLGHP